MNRLRHSSRARRSGYTLIEMLIAVSLVAVLMTVVWGLMSMYTTLQTAGSEVTSEQQLVRSVLQLIQDDLKTVPLANAEQQEVLTDPFAVFAPVIPEFNSDSIASDSVETVFEIADLIRNEDASPANVEFRGTVDAIRITFVQAITQATPTAEIDGLEQPTEVTAATLQDGIAPTVEEFQTVVYQFQPYQLSEATGLPSGLYRTQTNTALLEHLLRIQTTQDQNAVPSSLRLNKALIEALLFPAPDDRQSNSTDSTRQPTCDLIPDIVGLQFRYHDGDGWQRSWLSKRASQLPLAIEVTIDVITAQQLTDLRALIQTPEQPGRLEQHLTQAFTRTEAEGRRRPVDTLLEGLTITPHQYTSIILLDTTMEVSSQTYDMDLGGFGL